MSTPCGQKVPIARIETEMKDLKDIIKGNGFTPGVQTNLMELIAGQKLLVETVSELTENVRALIDFKVEVQAIKRNNRWIISIAVAMFTLFIAYLELKK